MARPSILAALLACTAISLTAVADSSNAETSVRIKRSLNDGWRFAYGAQFDPAKTASHDSTWKPVRLPHTWNGDDLWDDDPGYLRGTGWYHRRLTIPEDMRGQRLYLYFEGANQVAEVFINGKPVGTHRGGYTAFCFDITDAVTPQGANILAVRVDNSYDKTIPPLSADFTFYGGIYRDVWLIATAPVHFDMLDHASPGVFVDTPHLTADSVTVRVRGTIVNDDVTSGSYTVTTLISDAEGTPVAYMETVHDLIRGNEASFVHKNTFIAKPHLWSPTDPYLYSVRTELRQDDEVLDVVQNPLGLRWSDFDAKQGFSLNGKKFQLIGTNRHQDYAGLGNALPDRLHVRDLEIIKDMGLNFVRLAHYPQDPVVLETADRLGLIVWEEIPLVNYVTPTEPFAATARTMLTEMIRQHRNHPSILMWGYMNEIFLRPENGKADRPPDMTQGQYYAWVVKLAKELDAQCRKEDPTRATVMACQGGNIYDDVKLADVPQVLGWNLYNGWYVGEFADFGKYLDAQHTKHPTRVLLVSEYGAGSDLRLHSTAPSCFDFTPEWQELFHESHLDQIEARPFLAGSALWNQFDFGVEARGDSIPHLNQKGIGLYDRQPKDVYFFYQVRRADKSVLHIAARDWPVRRAIVDRAEATVTQPLCVYSNLTEVELLHNGKSLGKELIGDAGRARWNVPFVAGKNLFVARGMRNNEIVRDRAEVTFQTETLATATDIAVNVGAQVYFQDEEDSIWLADQAYTPGGWGYEDGDAVVGGAPNILGTDADPLYQTYRRNLTGYRFDVPDGKYRVQLLFAEREVKEAGKRRFKIRINDQLVTPEGMDLAAKPGPRRAAVIAPNATATGGSGIRIAFEPEENVTVLSGIRLRRSPSPN